MGFQRCRPPTHVPPRGVHRGDDQVDLALLQERDAVRSNHRHEFQVHAQAFGHVRGQRGFDSYNLTGVLTKSERGIVRLHADNQRAALLDRGEVISVCPLSLEGKQTDGEENCCQQV